MHQRRAVQLPGRTCATLILGRCEPAQGQPLMMPWRPGPPSTTVPAARRWLPGRGPPPLPLACPPGKATPVSPRCVLIHHEILLTLARGLLVLWLYFQTSWGDQSCHVTSDMAIGQYPGGTPTPPPSPLSFSPGCSRALLSLFLSGSCQSYSHLTLASGPDAG